jgi:hypothetical protein
MCQCRKPGDLTWTFSHQDAFLSLRTLTEVTSNTDARLASTDVTMVRTEDDRPACKHARETQEAALRLVHDDDLKTRQGHSFSARAEDGSGMALVNLRPTRPLRRRDDRGPAMHWRTATRAIATWTITHVMDASGECLLGLRLTCLNRACWFEASMDACGLRYISGVVHNDYLLNA